ncbi:MAG: DUF1292 domain-containing protein [Selenomonadaceae bacterium]|nr:DUF1292 domain-containing protein [Selenomonadaceae bacterium]
MAEELDEEDGVVVVINDDEGNEYYYLEEMIIPVGDERYALLVGLHEGEDGELHSYGCGCGDGADEEDEDVLFAKIVTGDDGEEEYMELTDEEFAAVTEAYEALVAAEEAEEE